MLWNGVGELRKEAFLDAGDILSSIPLSCCMFAPFSEDLGWLFQVGAARQQRLCLVVVLLLYWESQRQQRHRCSHGYAVAHQV